MVRKRPIFNKEEEKGEIDCINCKNPEIEILQPKFEIDGITKYIEISNFKFDNVFNEDQTT